MERFFLCCFSSLFLLPLRSFFVVVAFIRHPTVAVRSATSDVKKGRYKINLAQGGLVGFTANSIVSLPIRSPCFTIRSDWFMRRVSSSIFIELVEYGKTGIWMQLMSVMKFPVLASVENNIELVRDYCKPGVGGIGLLF